MMNPMSRYQTALQVRPNPGHLRQNSRWYELIPQQGQLWKSRKILGTEAINPQSYSYANRVPTHETVVQFERPMLGMGLRESDSLRPNMYYYALGVDLSCGGLACLGPEFTSAATLQSPVRQVLEFTAGGTRYLIALNGTRISYSTDGATWTTSKDITAQNPTQACVVDSGGTLHLLVATASGEMWQWDGTSATTTWTVGGAGHFDATSVCTIGGTGSVITAGGGATEGTSGGWAASPFYAVGGGTGGRQVGIYTTLPAAGAAPTTTVNLPDVVNWVQSLGNAIYAFCAGGAVYRLTATSAAAITGITEIYGAGTYSTDNGRNAVVWEDAVWAPYPGGSWVKIDRNGGVTQVGPDRITDFGVQTGGPTCSAGHNSWFNYVAVYSGAVTYLLKYGSWVNPEAGNSAEWRFISGLHGVLKSWAKKATAMFISDIGAAAPNAYLNVYFSDGSAERCVLPAYNPLPWTDSACRFQTSGIVYYSNVNAGYAADNKIGRAVTVYGPDLTASKYVTVRYAVDGGSYVALSNNFDVNGERAALPTGVVGKVWTNLEVTLNSSANTATPLVRGVNLHLGVRPTPVVEDTFLIKAEDFSLRRDGLPNNDGRTAKNIRDAIATDAASGSDVACTLPDGTTAQESIVDWEQTVAEDGSAAIIETAIRQTLLS